MKALLSGKKLRWFFWGLLLSGTFLYLSAPFEQVRNLSSSGQAIKADLSTPAATSGAIEVSVSPVGGIPDNDEQELTLKGTVTLHQLLEGEVGYRWTLPPEAQLVEGELEDSWADLPLNRPTEVKITITGVSKESPTNVVIFRAQNNRDGLPIGSFTTFSSSTSSNH